MTDLNEDPPQGRNTLLQRWDPRCWRAPGPRGTVAIVGLALVCAMALATALYEPVVAVAIPFGLLVTYLVMQYPLRAYAVSLCMLSIVPIEGQWFGKSVPNWTQLLVPLLVLGAIANAVRQRDARRFRLQWADLFVVGFLVLGYAAIQTLPGADTLKYFTKLYGFGAILYFVARWLPMDRRAFLRQLRWQLLAALWLCIVMTATPLIGWDPSYHGLGRLGLGAEARGPMWAISDTVAYTAPWVPLFLFATAAGLPFLRKGRMPWAWPLAVVCGIVATLATTERSGPLALAAALLVCCLHPRLLRYILGIGLLGAVLLPLWFSTSIGDTVHARMDTLKEEGAGFERKIYRQKALDYIHSPDWNPIMGTGYGRLTELAYQALPPDQWIYDFNVHRFRPYSDFFGRPTHCAPLAIYGMFGYGGVSCLLGLTVCVGSSMLRAFLRSRKNGRAFDSLLATALVASLATVLANGMYHNTEGVVQVLFLLWSGAGIIISHPSVLIVDPAEETRLGALATGAGSETARPA